MTQSHLPAGIDTEWTDEDVRVQDDLFRHVNGRWLREVEIPADKSSYGSFHMLHDEAEQAVRDIVEGEYPEGSKLRKAADAFAAFMNEELLEKLGAEPIAHDLMQVLATSNIAEFLALLGRQQHLGAGGFTGMYVIGDVGNPDTNILYLEQGGLGLPDEAYYREEQYAEIRAEYVKHIDRMLRLAGVPEADGRAQRVFDLETALASHHWDVVRTREADQTYNPTTLPEFLDGFGTQREAVQAWLDGLQLPQDALARFVVNEPSFFTGLATLLTEDRLDAWRDWLLWRIIGAFAADLSPEISKANFDFYGTTLQGTPVQRERWKRGVGHVESILGEVVGEEYVRRHFKPEAKAQMDELVGNLLAAYAESIRALTWMTDETRQKALEKLAKFTPKIGYPVKWLDYSKLEVRPDDLIGNSRRSVIVERAREFARIGQPVDRDLWLMTPQTVNAYYLPHQNEIVFPAAILQLPFFSPDRDAAANYGSIGAVIGHEIGHGFDDQGSKYDGDGRLENWWSDADREAFERHTKALIGQYSALQPEGLDEHVNGELTIGENIGDLGGLGIAWKAYLRSLNGAEPPVIDGLTGAQRFFLAWAESWRQKSRLERKKLLLAVDPHSPEEFRCNQIVRNLTPFYEAFDVQPSDKLWLDEAERVEIW